MGSSWTFARKLSAVFGIVVGLTMLLSVVSVYALRSAVDSKDQVITVIGENLLSTKELALRVERRAAVVRTFLLTKDQDRLPHVDRLNQEFSGILERLRSHVDPEQSITLDQIHQANLNYVAAIEGVTDRTNDDADGKSLAVQFEKNVAPAYETLNQLTSALTEREAKLRDKARQRSSDAASLASTIIITVAVIVVVAAVGLGFLLTRTLSRQIGAAFQHMQSASAELQAAANQQAASSKQQVSAVQEVQTTMRELLAAAEQIGESARHVSTVAGDSHSATRQGEEILQRGKASIAAVKQHVDRVVTQMVDMGRKSQRIGGVLELVNELAEQTNILAVNATIEAASAGEAGSRFAAVADEIRKLADRVGTSTREIRNLVEDVRESVNSTVMATESGSKAVDAGATEFDQVTGAFSAIANLVTRTAEAAREIELSTNQQTTAVEQVSTAVVDVSQAAQETNTSASQTLQTATQLATMSRSLVRLIHATNGMH